MYSGERDELSEDKLHPDEYEDILRTFDDELSAAYDFFHQYFDGIYDDEELEAELSDRLQSGTRFTEYEQKAEEGAEELRDIKEKIQYCLHNDRHYTWLPLGAELKKDLRDDIDDALEDYEEIKPRKDQLDNWTDQVVGNSSYRDWIPDWLTLETEEDKLRAAEYISAASVSGLVITELSSYLQNEPTPEPEPPSTWEKLLSLVVNNPDPERQATSKRRFL